MAVLAFAENKPEELVELQTCDGAVRRVDGADKLFDLIWASSAGNRKKGLAWRAMGSLLVCCPVSIAKILDGSTEVSQKANSRKVGEPGTSERQQNRLTPSDVQALFVASLQDGLETGQNTVANLQRVSDLTTIAGIIQAFAPGQTTMLGSFVADYAHELVVRHIPGILIMDRQSLISIHQTIFSDSARLHFYDHTALEEVTTQTLVSLTRLKVYQDRINASWRQTLQRSNAMRSAALRAHIQLEHEVSEMTPCAP